MFQKMLQKRVKDASEDAFRVNWKKKRDAVTLYSNEV